MSDGPDPLLVKVFEQLDSGQTPAQIARALRRDGHAVDDIRHAFRGAAALLRVRARFTLREADALDRQRVKLR
jgi:hypothetical protein